MWFKPAAVVRAALIVLLAFVCGETVCAQTTVAAGRTAGAFSVSPTGAATYTIPLNLPKGASGLQPQLFLQYNSQSPDGLLGPGWSLGGLSSITRCNLTVAQDQTAARVTLTAADQFCIDGNRLRIIGGTTYGADGAQYQTELADFSLSISHGTAGNGPAWFEVYRKDGLIYEYGNANVANGFADSRILVPNKPTAYAWALNKIRDRYGNNIIFTYTQSGGSYVATTIQYTGIGAAGTQYPYSVAFTYGGRPSTDFIAKYIDTNFLTQGNQLQSISVSAGTNTVRTYSLSYQASPTTYRSTLTSLQECSPSQCYPATTITYQYGAAGVVAPSTSTGITLPPNGYARTADLNGDGVADLLYPVTSGSSFVWYVAFGNTSGTFSAGVPTGITTSNTDALLIDDFLAEGQISILSSAGGTWHLIHWDRNQSAFVTMSTGTSVDTNATPSISRFASADVDGDGRPDLIALESSGLIYTRLNTSASGVPSFGALIASATVTTSGGCGAGYQLLGNHSFPLSAVTHVDANGDGRDDLIFKCISSGGGGNTQTSYEVLLTSSSTFSLSATLTNFNDSSDFIPLNFNNDGCTDFALRYYLYLSACDGSQAASINAPSTVAHWVAALDWDGDGRDDLLALDTSGNYVVYVSNSLGDLTHVTPLATGISGLTAFYVLDADGDGLADMAGSTNSGAIIYGLHQGAHALPDLATSIADGFGTTYSPVYTSTTNTLVYWRGSGAVFPERDWQEPMNVVGSYHASDGIGGTYKVTWFYEWARVNVQGRGFEGFFQSHSIDSRSGLYHYFYYGQAFPLTGLITNDDLVQADDLTHIRYITNTWNFTKLDSTNLRYFPYITQTVQADTEYLGSENGTLVTQKTTSYAYSGPNGYTYGNPSQITTTVVDADPNYPQHGWSYVDTLDITPHETGGTGSSGWCIHWPSTVAETRSIPTSASTSISSKRTVDYSVNVNSACELNSQILEQTNTTGDRVATSYAYDAHGNVSTVTVTGQLPSGSPMTARVTTYTFGSNGIAPISIQDPELHTTTLSYNYSADLSKPTGVQDPNGITTATIGYDDLGRRTLVQRPDGTQTSWQYINCPCGDPLLRYQITRSERDATANHAAYWYTNQYFDQFDRLIYDEPLQSNGVTATIHSGYDALGRLASTTNPYGNGLGGYSTSLQYDALDRPISATRPINAANPSQYVTATHTYAGRTETVTDFAGHTVTKQTDVWGDLLKIIDPAGGGSTTYAYLPFGQITDVYDPRSNHVQWGYDSLGYQLISRGDPDRGAATYQYDSLGQLVTFHDANNTSSTPTQQYAYDRLGRPTQLIEPEGTTTWTWGTSAAAHEIGRIHSVSNVTDTESYQYDNYGRPVAHTMAFGGTNYVLNASYDANIGKLSTVTYPQTPLKAYPFAVRYSYANGYLATAQDYSNNTAGTTFWSLTAGAVNMDPWGHITDETLGTTTPVRIKSSYDAVTGWLTLRQAGSGSSSNNLQYLTFNWDAVGNLTNRQDQNQVLTEAFTHDALNRLAASTLNGTTNLTVAIDTAGNITSKTDPLVAGGVAQAYTYDTSHPHAVHSVGSGAAQTTYGYDFNGNMNSRVIGGASYTVSWLSFNQPYVINGPGGASTTYIYGPDHLRRQQVAVYPTGVDGNSGTETTVYVGNLLEVETTPIQTHYKHFIAVPGGTRIIYDLQASGGTQVTYVSTDHLGSASMLINMAGAKLIQESYAAYGYRRSANWGSLLSPTASDYNTIASTTRRGYTDAQHEILDNVGLINMNGRIYDPTIGRFLSADPTPAYLGPSQQLNPYSYVGNSVLEFTDPTGFDANDPGSLCQNVSQQCSCPNPADLANCTIDITPHKTFCQSNPTACNFLLMPLVFLNPGTAPSTSGGQGSQSAAAKAQGTQPCTRGGGGRSILDNLPSVDLPSLPDGLVNFSAGLGDALLLGLGNAARDLLGVNGSVDTGSGAYSAGSWTSFGFGVGRLGYAAVARGYSIFAESGAAASAFRSSMRMPGAPVRDLTQYATDDALRAAAGRTNPYVNAAGAGVAAAGEYGATAGCR